MKHQFIVGDTINIADMDPELARAIFGEELYEEVMRLAAMPAREVTSTVVAVESSTITLNQIRDTAT